MVHIGVRFDVQISRSTAAIERMALMGKDWMTKFLNQRDVNRKTAERKAELDSLALAQIPETLKRLTRQMKSDLEQYNKASSGQHVEIKERPQDNSLEASCQNFPHFWLRLEPQKAGIGIALNVKKSSSDSTPRSEKTILVIAKAMDELYYRLDGTDYADESEVSEQILRPLLEVLS